MTDKEFAEIRKRFKPEKSNITAVKGCYVNSSGEKTSDFRIPVMTLPDEQKEWLFKILKKPVSGAVGRNLMNIEFSADQVTDGEEHKLLTDVRESELDSDEILDRLFDKIISCYHTDGDYIILLAYDRYDVPSFSKNDEDLLDSGEMFRYFVCCICPIKVTKTALGFSTADLSFRNIGADSAVSAPEIGFMFPCFDDRRTNIYNAVFYTKSTSENYPEFVETMFGASPQMPAAEQKSTFRSLVSTAAPESCSYEFVQSVHGMLSDMITEHKESHDPEPLMLDKNDVRRVLATCGADEGELEGFDEKFTAGFGETKEIPPQNIVDTNGFELKNSYVSVKVDPEYSFMVNAKVIDGVRYVMIRADEGVEVNGINIRFDGDASALKPAELDNTIEDTAATTAEYNDKPAN